MLHICGIMEICGINDACACVLLDKMLRNAEKCDCICDELSGGTNIDDLERP